MKKQQLWGLALTLASLTTVSAGCSVDSDHTQSGTGTSASGLPQLTSTQSLRDDIARSESAIATNAHFLSSLATACEACADVLTTVSDDASARLQLDGGMWTPWPDAQSGQDLPLPAETADTPLTPAGLAGYMAESARSQLESLASNTDVDESETITLAATIAGRWASADALADFYGVDLVEASEALDPAQLVTRVGAPTGSEDASTQNAEIADQSGLLEEEGSQRALITFDCAATATGRSSFSTENPNSEQHLYDSLTHRSVALIEAGVNDNRPARCDAEPQSIGATMNDLIGADIDVLTSTNPTVRQLGAQYIVNDLQFWSQFETLPTITLGVTDAS